jgi:hypothetical protein
MADDEESSTERRRRLVAALPATFADSYSIDWGADSVRITFAEYLYRQRHYRVAVVLPMEDAERLGNSLLDIARRAKRERDEQESSAG